jgi:hypothetical protein
MLKPMCLVPLLTTLHTLGFEGSAAAAAARSVTDTGACFAFAVPALTVPITNFSSSSLASCRMQQPQQVSHSDNCSSSISSKVTQGGGSSAVTNLGQHSSNGVLFEADSIEWTCTTSRHLSLAIVPESPGCVEHMR